MRPAPQVGTQYPATMNPRGRSSPQHEVRSVDRHGSVGQVGRERRWNTTSVSRETTGRFGFGVWKRYRCEIHERCCVLRCLCLLIPETMNTTPRSYSSRVLDVRRSDTDRSWYSQGFT